MKAKVYICDVGFLEDPAAFERVYRSVPEYRRKKADAYRFRKDRVLSLGAGYLLSKALAEHGIAEAELEIAYTENGHPYFQNRPDLHFSLAHAGSYAMCILSDQPAGCDVEIRAGNEDMDLVRWTKMESYLKATDGVIDEVLKIGDFTQLGFDFYSCTADEAYVFMVCVKKGTIMEGKKNEYYFKC